jgi:F1F0 ATPase subunit 2
MSEAPTLILALFAGAVLGAMFFGALWWTIRSGLTSKRPVILFLGSLLLRMGLALGGFYLVARGDWRNLVACLLGFFIARLLVTRHARYPTGNGNRLTGGGGT